MRKLALAVTIVVVMCTLAAAQEAGKTDAKRTETVHTDSAPDASRTTALYRLDFTITELEDGRKVNARSYSTQVQTTGRNGFLKVGSRVPVDNHKGELQYMDVGVNMDFFQLLEHEGLLTFNMSGDISSVATEAASSSQLVAGALPPVLRQARFGGPVAVAPGKPTVLYTLDDVNSKHRFQIELTATKLK